MKPDHRGRASSALLEQEHLELQNDAGIRLYRSRLTELQWLSRQVQEQEAVLQALHRSCEERTAEAEALARHLEKMSRIQETGAASVKFGQDYEARQRYYEQESNVVAESAISDLALFVKRNRKAQRIVVSPDGLLFPDQRPSLLLRKLASEDYLCFQYDPQIDGVAAKDEYGVLRFRDEPLMLQWLRRSRISPVILCTWVLQSAWYDLLPDKTVWYDVCADERELFGMDAESRFKHFELLKTSKLVSYSDKRWRKYTAMRKDAIYLPAPFGSGNWPSIDLMVAGGSTR